MEEEVVLNFDGGIRNGLMAYGFCATEPGRPQKVLFGGSNTCGEGTSNVAEYRALIAGLEECLRKDVKVVRVIGDSQLVVNHVRGTWKAKNDTLIQHLSRVQNLLERFEGWSIKWVRRDQNRIADALVNDAFKRHG